MKIRRHADAGDGKVDVPMAPMIDVVFQLLIFFMLTLKIVAPEGDFNINMPIGQATADAEVEPNLDIKVRLTADDEGNLTGVFLGSRALGADARVFDRLNVDILGLVGRPGERFSDDIEVEIDADYNLDYGYVIQAVSAVTGRLDPVTKRPVRYVEKIKFAPPRRPEA